MSTKLLSALFAVVLGLTVSAAAYATPTDWPPPRVPRATPEGLACAMPRIWQSERVNQPYPRTPLAVDEHAVYTGSDHLYALDKTTGAVLWRFEMPETDYEVALRRNGVNALAVDKDTVYFGGYADMLYAVDKRTGQERWHRPILVIGEAFAMDDDRLYFSSEGKIFAVNKKTGEEIWSVKGAGTPVLMGDAVYAFDWKNIIALNRRSGEVLWRSQEMESNFSLGHSVPYAYQNQLMGYTNGNIMYSFDTRTGEQLWSIGEIGNSRARAMAGLGDTVLFYSPLGNLALFDIKQQQPVWGFTSSAGETLMPPAIYKGLILLGSDNDAMFVLDYATGQEVFRFELVKRRAGIPINDEDVRAIRAVVVQDDVVYFTSVDGKIYAYKLDCPQLEGRTGF